MAQIPCSHCQSMLVVPQNAEGKLIRCPQCQETTRAPAAFAAGPAPRSAPLDDEDRPRRNPRRDDDDEDRPRNRRIEEDDDRPRKRGIDGDDDRPRRRDLDDDDRPRRREKKAPKAGNSLVTVGIVGLVIALALGIFTWLEGSIAFQSSAQPEEITLQNLIARGSEGNPNIRVTQFVLCQNFVKQENSKNPGSWTHVWIPAVPPGEVRPGPQGQPTTPTNVKMLFFSTSIRNEPELEARLNRPTVEGIVNTRTSLSGEIRALLQRQYPGTDLDKCIIVQEGRKPFDRTVIYAMAAGSGVFLLVSLILLLVALLRK